jgi:UDP-N-acetylglucosamine:LPS N-acetylglucosamine transferase
MGSCRRVLVVSASMGAGHHAAAQELVRRLRRRGRVAERIDVLELGRPGQGRRLKATYAVLLDRLPWLYDLALRFWARWPAPLEVFTARGAAAYEDGLLAEVRGFRPDVVVSVYNLASQALGRLRRAGVLDVPTVTYVTEPAAHPYWFHPGVDLHLAFLDTACAALASWGARRTARVAPLVRPPSAQCIPGRADARQRLGLPAGAKVALLTGGAWAVGHLPRTAELLAASGEVVPVVMCGTNTRLQRQVRERGVGLAVGWTDDVPALMAAADVLVCNAGGLTCQEALAAGLPVVLFDPLPGHGRPGARALEDAGLAAWARRDGDLLALVDRLSSSSPERAAQLSRAAELFHDDPVDPILDLCGDPTSRSTA